MSPLPRFTDAGLEVDTTTTSNLSAMSSLVTPGLIARALAKPSLTIEKKYVEVYEEYTIKLGPGVKYYEYRVLKFLETHPRIPTPRSVDFFSIRVPKRRRVKGQFEEYMEEWNVIVMSTMPGRPLGSTSHCMSPDQRVEVLKEVEVAMNQLNEEIELGMGAFFVGATGDLKPLQRPHHSISDLDGLKCLKLPLRNGFTDSAVDIEDFIKTMSATAPQPEARAEMLNSVLSLLQPQLDIGSSHHAEENPMSVRFCHMNLHLDNIMVQDGRLSGIIDWEMAGWYTRTIETFSALVLYGDQPERLAEYANAWKIDPALKHAAWKHGRLQAIHFPPKDRKARSKPKDPLPDEK